MADEVRPAAGARGGHRLLLALCGLLLAGAAPLFALVNTHSGLHGGHGGIWTGYAPLTRTTYFPPPPGLFMFRGVPYGPSFYYLGWYWALALAAGYLLAVLWNRWQARRSGRPAPSRGYLLAAVVLTALALTLPPLTQAAPWLSGLWLRGLWVKGIPALLITGCVLAAVARAERSRRLAMLVVLYAVAALLSGGSLALMPDEMLSWWPALAAWPDSLTPVGVLLLPATLLVIAGLAVRAPHHRATPSP